MAAWGPSDYARRASDSPIASKGTWEANGRGGGSFAVLGCATLNRRNWWITVCPLSGGDRRKRTFVQAEGRGATQPPRRVNYGSDFFERQIGKTCHSFTLNWLSAMCFTFSSLDESQRSRKPLSM